MSTKNGGATKSVTARTKMLLFDEVLILAEFDRSTPPVQTSKIPPPLAPRACGEFLLSLYAYMDGNLIAPPRLGQTSRGGPPVEKDRSFVREYTRLIGTTDRGSTFHRAASALHVQGLMVRSFEARANN